MNIMRRSPAAIVTALLTIGAASFSAPSAAEQPAPLAQKTFASPQDAVQALLAAVKVHDKVALRDIFGPRIHELLTGDEVLDKNNSQKFAAALEESVKPLSEGDGKVILEIGANKWPFPIPLVKAGSNWRFDTDAGKEEILSRHIGKNELHAIGVCRAYARARIDGGSGAVPNPIHGYRFRILTRQGAAAPGGKMDYVNDGGHSGGFALAAYPEHWGRSGIMTFIINRDGEIYRRDLGEKTSRVAAAMAEYNPDGGWTLEKDEGVVAK